MWKSKGDHLCIAISGLSGCGNTSVSKALAHKLQVAFINYTFRTLAEEEGIDFDELRKKAETDDSWDLLVDQRQVELARQEPCVIGSRLAIWMVPFASLKIYLVADEEVRVQRIVKREGGDYEETLHRTHDRDLSDQKRYMNLYQINVKTYQHQADLVINANSTGIDEIVDIIIKALEKKSLITKE